MKNRVLFPLFCALLSLWLWSGSQPAYANTDNKHAVGRAAWAVAPLPPPTSTPMPDPKAPMTATLDAPFAVRIGQWATIRDTPEELGVQLYGLVGDSRCPAEVDCAVAGQVEFILIVRQGTVINQERFQIGTYTANDENKIYYAGYEIELTGVEPPAPAPEESLLPSDYVATLVVHAYPFAPPVEEEDEEEAQAVDFNQPFSLLVGETATIREADFHLTLRSLSEDSGCLSVRDCSTMLADGTLVLAQGDDSEVLTFSTSFSADQAFSYEFAGYLIQLTHVEQSANGDQVATFVITKPDTSGAIPAPERIDRCPAFSRFDAAAILQEDVEQEAVANLVFGPIAADAWETRGLCGYIGTTYTTDQLNDDQTAYLATELPADHAVAAMMLEGEDVMQMLQLAEIVRATYPDADPDELQRLQTQVAAGDYAEVISYLSNTAAEVPTFTVNNIQGIGDDAVWLWQELDRGHLAMFISRTGQTFSVVVGLVGEEVDELTVLDYAVIIVRRMDNEPLTQAEPNDMPIAGCELLSADDAAAILGEPVHQPVLVEEEGGICLYVPRSEPAVTAEEATRQGPAYGIFTQVIAQEDAAQHITNLVDEILLDNPDASDAVLALLEASLMVGNTTTALQLLPRLVEDTDNWEIEDVSEIGEGAIWIWYEDSELVYSALMMPSRAGDIHMTIASFYEVPDQSDVRDAMLEAAADWDR